MNKNVNFGATDTAQTYRVTPLLDFGNALNGVFFLNDAQDAQTAKLQKILVPTSATERRKFARTWARKNARRIAEGFGAMALLLPLATAASAQEAYVVADTIEGVVDVALQDNGDVVVTLANGQKFRIDSENVDIGNDGIVLISAGAADAVVLAAADGEEAAGPSGIAAIGVGVAGLAVAAAGGGGGGGEGTTSQPVETAFVIDGYISGATVFGDANGNLILDAGEVQTVTEADGSFNSALFGDDVPLVSIGGIDISTGEEFTGTLKAPAGSGVITPLTTLVQALVEESAGSETPLTAAEAASQVASSLGLTEGNADILNSDPVALAEAGDLSQLQAAAKIAAVINLVSAAAPGNPEAVDAVLKSLTTNLVDGEGDDPFGDPTQIVTALNAAGEGAIQVNTDDLANAIVDVATLIDTVEAGAIADLEQIQAAVQGQLTEAVEGSVGDTDGTTPLNTAVVSEVVATTVPRPVITSATSAEEVIADGTEIIISGSGPAGATINVELGDAAETASVVDGTWTVTFAQDTDYVSGPLDISLSPVVTATIGGNTSSGAINAPVYDFDVTPPAIPTIIDRSVTIADTDDGIYRMVGNADAGTTVTLTQNGVELPSVVAAEDGTWFVDVAITPGDDVFSVASVDSVGNRSESGQTIITVDLEAPTIGTTTAPTSLNGDTDASVDFSGSVQGATTVTVEITRDDTVVLTSGPLTPAATGEWSTNFDFSALDDGTYTATVIASDAVGNRTESVLNPITLDATAPDAPSQLLLNGAGDDALVNIAEQPSANLTGTAVAGATVTIAIGGTFVGTAIADGEGAFTFALDGLLSEGENAITVTQADGAGNVSSAGELTVNADLTPPSAVTINTIAGDDIIADGETGDVIFSGTGTNGDTVELLIGADIVGTAVIANGIWEITANIPGVNGDFVATANVTDAAGNSGTAATRDFTVDATDPAVTIDTLLIGDVANATEIQSPLTVTGTFANATSVSVQLLSGSTPVGGAVEATLDGATWSATILDISGLVDGAYTVEATGSDGISDGVQTIGFDVDATAPDAPTIAVVSDDNLVGTGDLIGGNYTLTGSTEPGSTVAVTIGGTTESATVTGTTWTYDVTAVDAAVDEVTVVVTDAAGNPSTPATTTISVDLSAPDAPLFTSGTGTIDGGGIGSVVISGTAEANTTVTLSSALFDADIDVAVGGDGNWETDPPLDLSGNADGDYTITAVAADAAGNTSSEGSATRAVDVVPDGPVTITIAGDLEGSFRTEGELILYDSVEFVDLTGPEESTTIEGNVQGVPAGTVVTVSVTLEDGTVLPDSYTGPTAGNGDFIVNIPDSAIEALDGMTEAATVTISAGGASFTLDLLVNSNIGLDGSGVFLAGTTAITPADDILAVGGDTATRTLIDGGPLSNGLTVAVFEVVDLEDLNSESYRAIVVYDGQSATPVELFAFDGGIDGEITARSTKIAVHDDGILISQVNVTGTEAGGDLAQTDPLYTLYTVPGTALLAALPDTTSANFATSASGVTLTDITLADVGGAPFAGDFYDLEFIPGVSGDPVAIMARQPLAAGGEITEAVIVKIDADTGQVTDRAIDVQAVAPSGDLDIQTVVDAIETDAGGNYTTLRLDGVDFFDGFTRGVIYDFQNDRFTNETIGGNDVQDLMVAQGGREILDGGDVVSGNDNDVFVVGNQDGTIGPVRIEVLPGAVSGNTLDVSVDTDFLLSTFGNTGEAVLPIDFFIGGSVTLETLSNFSEGTYITLASPPQPIDATEGFSYVRVDLTVDLAAVNTAQPQSVQLFSTEVEPAAVDGSSFYGLGISNPAENGDPMFEGFQTIGGVDGEGRQTIILKNSQARGGFDLVGGFDVSDVDPSNEDLLVIEADFGDFRGTGIEYVGFESPLTFGLGATTGIVIFEGDNGINDPEVQALAASSNLGLSDGESVIALVAEGNTTSLWTLTANGGDYEVDSFANLNGVSAADLRSFTDDDFTNIQLQLPTV